MGLGDKNLGAGFMNQGYGRASTVDEQELIRMRASSKDTSDVEDAYNRTGNLRVANTLARYKDGGRAGDPYEYKRDGDKILTRKKKDGGEWTEATGKARDAIIKKGLVDPDPKRGQTVSGLRLGEQPVVEEEVIPDDFVGPVIPQGLHLTDKNSPFRIIKEDFEEGFSGQKIVEDEPDALGVRQKRVVPKTAEDYGEFTDVEAPVDYSDTAPPAPAPERYVGTDQVVPETGSGGGGGTTPQINVSPEEVQGIGLEDRSLLGYSNIPEAGSRGIVRPDFVPAETPQAGPSWWDENQRGLGQGASNVAAGLLNIAPNIANMKAYNNIQGVRPSNLQKTVTSKAPSGEASRQAVIAQGRNAAQRAQGMSPQDQLAASAQAMAGTQSALSRLGDQQAQIEAQYNARNAAAQNRASAQNQATLNRELQQQQSRDMMQLRGLAQERGAIGTKSLGFLGDLSKQKLDREKMDLTRQRYNIYDQLDRAALKQFEDTGILPEGYRSPTGQRD